MKLFGKELERLQEDAGRYARSEQYRAVCEVVGIDVPEAAEDDEEEVPQQVQDNPSDNEDMQDEDDEEREGEEDDDQARKRLTEARESLEDGSDQEEDQEEGEEEEEEDDERARSRSIPVSRSPTPPPHPRKKKAPPSPADRYEHSPPVRFACKAEVHVIYFSDVPSPPATPRRNTQASKCVMPFPFDNSAGLTDMLSMLGGHEALSRVRRWRRLRTNG